MGAIAAIGDNRPVLGTIAGVKTGVGITGTTESGTGIVDALAAAIGPGAASVAAATGGSNDRTTGSIVRTGTISSTDVAGSARSRVRVRRALRISQIVSAATTAMEPQAATRKTGLPASVPAATPW